MNTKKLVCCWDLEGPISIIDFAAELGKNLNKKLGLNLLEYDMAEFFTMISNYDDYIIDVTGVKEQLNIPEYQPGDTLRLMAPLYASCYTDEELINKARSNMGLLPGCKELMKILHKDWDIFVISTSYTHFAHNVTKALEIPRDHVYCTDFNIKNLKKGITNIEEAINVLIKKIFKKYLTNGKDLNSIIEDLNEFFWLGSESDYIKIMNKVIVRGGRRKELAVEEISKRTGISISEMIALGDSITDINMLHRLNDEGSTAISFNGNKFSVKQANVALTTPNSLGALPIFQEFKDLDNFLEVWELNFLKFENDPNNIPNDLISNQCKELFLKYNFIPEIINLKNKSNEQIKAIILRQEKMRKFMRGWASDLG
ncbi:MAG: HAD hydrolase family protein [Promethearchaeota archaeon]